MSPPWVGLLGGRWLGIGPTSVPQGRTQGVPASGFCLLLFIWFQVSLPPQLRATLLQKKPSTSSPWVPHSRSGQGEARVSAWKCLQGLAGSKLPLRAILGVLLWVRDLSSLSLSFLPSKTGRRIWTSQGLLRHSKG